MRKINDCPLIYEREDGSCVLFIVCHLEEESQQLVQVGGTFDYCRGYYDGLSQITSGVSAVDSDTAEDLASSNECANCGGIWRDDDLKPISDYFERVEAGGIVPSGECPNCHALCFPTTV